MKLTLFFLPFLFLSISDALLRPRRHGGPLNPAETVSDFIELKVLHGGTPEQLVEFFTDDALVVHEGQPSYRGKQEIEQALSWVNHVDVTGTYDVVNTIKSGTLAGVYVKVNMTISGGPPAPLKYREFYSLVKRRGEYKIAMLINNEDLD